MTQEEKERATERRLTNMTTAKSICEIRLHNAMVRNNLTLEECINAIDTYAMDKKFHDDLDKYTMSNKIHGMIGTMEI